MIIDGIYYCGSARKTKRAETILSDHKMNADPMYRQKHLKSCIEIARRSAEKNQDFGQESDGTRGNNL